MTKQIAAILLVGSLQAAACDMAMNNAVVLEGETFQVTAVARNIGPSSCDRVRLAFGEAGESGFQLLTVEALGQTPPPACSSTSCSSLFERVPVGGGYKITLAAAELNNGCITSTVSAVNDRIMRNDTRTACADDLASAACAVVEGMTISADGKTRVLLKNSCKRTIAVQTDKSDFFYRSDIPVSVVLSFGAIYGGVTHFAGTYTVDLSLGAGARFVLEADAGAGCVAMDLDGAVQEICF